MANPFSSGAAAGGSSNPFSARGGSAPAKSSGRGGILGGIENAAHWTADKAALAGHDLKSIPGGLIQLGEATVKSADPLAGLVQSHIPHVPGVPNTLQPNQAGAPDLTTLLKQQAKGTVHVVEHPLADPFQTLVTFAPFLHLAGSAGIRGGAAVGAVRAGEGVTGAVKAAAAKPDLGPRLLTHGDTQVHLQESTNPFSRLVQAGYDKVLQHGLDTNPEGRVAAHAEKRIGGSLDETARYKQRLAEAPAVALDQIAKKLTPKLAKGERRVNQAALELTSVNTMPEAAATYHLGQAGKGVDAARNTAVARLYQTVHDAGLLTTNEHGDVIVNAADHPKLAQADLKLAQVQGRGDEILTRYGIRTPDQLAQAVNAPGKYRAGATYENPTPGKLGKPSQGLLKQQARVARLETLHAQATAKAAEKATPYPNVHTRTGVTVASAEARLAKLEAAHQADLDKIVEARFGKIPHQQETGRARTNAAIRKARASGGATGRLSLKRTKPSILDEQRAVIEQEIQDAAAKNPEHPAGAAWNARTSEIDALRARLNPDIGEKVDLAPLATKHEEVPAGPKTPGEPSALPPKGVSNPTTDRLGAALSVERDKLAQMEQAAAARVTPTGVVGGETAAPGRGHVSYAASEKRAPASPAAGSPGPVVGEARSPITSHANTGYNIEHGLVPEDITGQAARKYRSIIRFVNTTERRNAAIRTGSDVKRSARDVLAAVPGEEHAKFSQALEEELGQKRSTTGTVDGLNAALDAYRESIVPGLADNFAGDAAHEPGTSAADAAAARGLEAPNGYKWVSRHTLGELAKPGVNAPRHWIAKGADNINTAVTSATVYFKLGHIGTRFVTNAATNIIQGSATPLQIAKSTELWKVLTPEEKAQAFAVAGQHSFAALPLSEGTGRITRGISATGRAGAHWWAKHADAPFRFNSIAYEARKAGFDTPEKFRLLLDQLANPHAHNLNAAQAAKIDWVAKRANREGIAYDRLSDFEKRYITRAFWFYPWTAGATRFAVNTLLEHPYKSAALGNLGVQGRETQQFELGDLPSYEQGLVKLSGHGNNPLVSDFSTLQPFSTPGDLLQVPSVGSASSYLNPVYGALAQLAFRQNQYGQHSNHPLGDAISAMFSPTPEAQILNSYLKPSKPTAMFHKTPWNMLARAAAGAQLPRRLNVTAANKAAVRERAGR